MNTSERAPLLLLHGFPLTAAMWRHTIRHFSGRRTVIAPEAADLVQGTLDNPSMAAMAEAAHAALDQSAPEQKAVVIGLSMGGYVAQEFVRAFPHRLAALALCDTRCTADTEDARRNRDAMIAAVQRLGAAQGTEALVNQLPSARAPREAVDEMRKMAAGADSDTIVALIRALRDRRDTCDTLATVAVPALLVRGEDDSLAPPATVEAMRKRLPGAQAVEIPNAGHVPPMEAPDAFNRALEGFLDANGL